MSASDTDPLAGVHPVLRKLSMLEFMAPDARRLVADSFTARSFPFGSVIVREGEPATTLYVLASGRARAIKRSDDGVEVPLGTIAPGDTFGEHALLRRTTRTATVRATEPVDVFELDQSIFRAIVDTHAEVRRAFELHTRRRTIANFLSVHSAFSDLPTGALALMLDALEPVPVTAGDTVVRQGDPAGPMFIVQHGRLRAYRTDGGASHDVAYLRTGDYFGELSLFDGSARQATVQAVTDARLLRLAQETFAELMDCHEKFRTQIATRAAQYDYAAVARVPLDFAEEILPVAPDALDVAPGQPVDHGSEATDEPTDVEPRTGASTIRTVARRDRIRRFPHVWQLDAADCGAACLAMVTRHFGHEVSVGHIRAAAGTGVDGTSLRGLTEGGRAIGLVSRSVKVSESRLDEMPLPAVVHWEGNHWVVLHDVDRRRVRIADPARGGRRLRREEFLQRWTGYAAVFSPGPGLADAPVQPDRMRWVWPFLRPYRATFAWAALLALLGAGAAMLIPVVTQVVIDRVIVERDIGLLTLLVGAMVGVLMLTSAASIGQRYLVSRAAVRIDGATLDHITGRLLTLPMAYFHTRRTGDISRRLTGVRQAREFLVQQGIQALTAGTQVVAAVALMFVYSWSLTLVFLSVVPVYVLLVRFAALRLRPMFDSLEAAFGTYHARQIDALNGIETVKAMAAEPTLRARMLRRFGELAHRVFRADLTIAMYEGGTQIATLASLALFLWAGALQVLNGTLTVGEFVSFNALVLLANAPLQQLLINWDEFQLASVLLDRLNDVLEHEPEQGRDHGDLRPVPTLAGAIQMRDVSFAYPGADASPILQHVSLDIAAGTTVAVVGRSGSGKSTLVRLLAGLVEPTAGTITYDGVDLATLEHRDVRRRIGVVLQDPYVFDDTIAQNIAFGDEDPDMQRVAAAAQMANVHDVIARLPFGYDTRVGETGILLSGGQRQRVAIARALYGQPAVLLFDEATSALDTESERAVQDNIAQMLEGRTAVIVAHRLSTVRDADLIVVLERGRLVERGTHEQLMARRGLYFYLASQQLAL
jgi:ABC-type bacteriocin/lantibiotic exporter with double-glycine peptidase domain/CRP-like cAMP-binding protein